MRHLPCELGLRPVLLVDFLEPLGELAFGGGAVLAVDAVVRHAVDEQHRQYLDALRMQLQRLLEVAPYGGLDLQAQDGVGERAVRAAGAHPHVVGEGDEALAGVDLIDNEAVTVDFALVGKLIKSLWSSM